MIRLKLIRLLTALMCLWAQLANAAGTGSGTESGGGGGTTVSVNGQRMLLDYLWMDPQLPDDSTTLFTGTFYNKLVLNKEFLKNVHSKVSTVAANQLPKIAASPGNKNHLETAVDFFLSDPFRMALGILDSWDKNNFLNLTSNYAIWGLFTPVYWIFTSDAVKGPTAPLQDFTGLDITSPRLAAYYRFEQGQSGGNYDVTISSREWNELGILSQTGLIIHEGFRHVQFDMGTSDLTYTDTSLQKATAIVMLCQPDPYLSQYLNFILAGREDIAEQQPQYGKFQDVIKLCHRRYCSESKCAKHSPH